MPGNGSTAGHYSVSMREPGEALDPFFQQVLLFKLKLSYTTAKKVTSHKQGKLKHFLG